MLAHPARRGAEQRTTHSEAASDRPRLRVVGNPNGHVDTLADQADRMVIDIQLQAQLWIAARKSGNSGEISCIAVKCAQATRSVPLGSAR
jgi:hypothetical protein